MALMGVKQIEMYFSMVNDWFSPILEEIERRVPIELEREIRLKAKKDLGVYDLLVEKAAHEERIKEIEILTKDAVERKRQDNGAYMSKVEMEAARLTASLNPMKAKVEQMRHDFVDDIKLASASKETMEFFRDVRLKVANVLKEVKALAPISVSEVKRLK